MELMEYYLIALERRDGKRAVFVAEQPPGLQNYQGQPHREDPAELDQHLREKLGPRYRP